MSLKLYTDTHIAKQVAIQLRNRGVDIVRCEEVGMAEATDEEHLAYATKEGRALVSMDRDFKRFYFEWIEARKNHAGIFSISRKFQNNYGIGRMVSELYEYWQLIEIGAGTVEKDIYNQIIWIK